MNKRNLIPQRILMKDGTTKTIFHTKKWPSIDRKQWWDDQNHTPVKARIQNKFKTIENVTTS